MNNEERKQSAAFYFAEKAKKVHKDKYDYSLVNYTNNKIKVKIICPIHGVFEQTPNNHLRGQGCPKCKGLNLADRQKLNTKRFIRKAEEIHNDKCDYSLVEYNGCYKKIKIICKYHGLFEQMAYSHLAGHGCPKCVKNKGEEKTEQWLISNNLKYKRWFKFETLKDKSQLSYDFFIPDKNILIELNGQQHYKFHNLFHKNRNDFLKQKHHDWLKRKYAKDNGYDLLVIPYWDFKNISYILEENLRNNPLK